MTTEKILIIMLLYILGCVVVYYLITKYVFDRKRKKPGDIDGGKSLIDELEIEKNIFDIPKNNNGIDNYEIDSPYKKTTVDDVLHSPEKNGKASGIQNKIRRLLE